MAPGRANSRIGKGSEAGKVDVLHRRSGQRPRRENDWSAKARRADDYEIDPRRSVPHPKEDLSRHRISVKDDKRNEFMEDLRSAVVMARRALRPKARGDERLGPCSVPRVARVRRRLPSAVPRRVIAS
jgi:hypothetical protein